MAKTLIVKLFSPKSLRVRLMMLVFLAVIPTWIAIAFTAAGQRQAAVAEIQSNVLRLVESSAREEEQVLLGTRQVLIALANFVRKTDGSPSECSEFCADLLKYPLQSFLILLINIISVTLPRNYIF